MAFEDLDALLGEGAVAGATEPANRPIVVVVDDNPSVREMLEFLLRDSYEVRLSASAIEGLELVDDHVSVVILDIKMKGHDGFWARKAIAEKCSHVPVIFHSAYQDLKNPYEVINEFRPFGYIVKGGDSKALLSIVADAVRYSSVILSNKRTIDRLQRVQAKMSTLKKRPP